MNGGNKDAGQTSRDEHLVLTTSDGAKRVLMIGFDGINHKVVTVDSDGHLQVDIAPVVRTPLIFRDTSFVVGDSPVVLDVNNVYGVNGREFTIINDGAGEFTVSISNDGSVFGNEHTMKNGEVYEKENISLDSIRITHVADSAYRVVAL